VSDAALHDASGCLTAAGLDAIDGAGPGGAPEELARHLAGCARCQDRMLERASGPRTGRTEAANRRRLWTGLAVVLGMMLLALLSLLGTLLWVRGR
jgi:hypothetical protein